MNIVFFGDSLTQGTYGVSYVDKVASAFPQHRFINRGMNGDTSLNLYRRVTRDVIDLRPDGVFIMVGANDAVSYVEPGMKFFFRLAKNIPGGQMSPISARENMRAILSRLEAARIRSWVALPPAEYSPRVVEVLRKVNASTAEVCAEMQIPTLDVLAKLTPQNIPERPPLRISSNWRNPFIMLSGKSQYNRLREAGNFTYSFDGFHLTEDGAQRIADLIVPFLRANGVS